MKDNNPYSEFATFDFSKILERLTSKGKLAYLSKLSDYVKLDRIGLCKVSTDKPIYVAYTYDRECHTDYMTLWEFKKFLESNKESTYTIYYVGPIFGINTFKQSHFPTKEQFKNIPILHIIRTNPDGSEELINKDSLK